MRPAHVGAAVSGRARPGQWRGGWASERAHIVLAPNPSPMTLEGTNTYLLLEPGADEAVVVDPGPLDEAHLQAVVEAARSRGARIRLILLTHHHADHEAGAARLSELTHAPVHSRGRGHVDLRDGQWVEVGGLRVQVLATPGHTADSVSFLLPDEGTLLTGDTVLGWGTTVVAWPDGELAPYLRSLTVLRGLTAGGEVGVLLPAHGAPLDDADRVVDYYQSHRAERLEQVRRVVDAGAGHDVEAVVRTVYADVPREVWPAARLSVRAQLEYLRAGG